MKTKRFNKFAVFYNRRKRRFIKIFRRSLIITKSLIGIKVFVYNGNRFISFKVAKEYVGLKFGEFAFTKQSLSALIHRDNKFDKKKKKLRKKRVNLRN